MKTTQEVSAQVGHSHANAANANVNTNSTPGVRYQLQRGAGPTDPSPTRVLLCPLFNNDALLQELGDQVGDGSRGEASHFSEAYPRDVFVSEECEKDSAQIVRLDSTATTHKGLPDCHSQSNQTGVN